MVAWSMTPENRPPPPVHQALSRHREGVTDCLTVQKLRVLMLLCTQTDHSTLRTSSLCPSLWDMRPEPEFYSVLTVSAFPSSRVMLKSRRAFDHIGKLLIVISIFGNAMRLGTNSVDRYPDLDELYAHIRLTIPVILALEGCSQYGAGLLQVCQTRAVVEWSLVSATGQLKRVRSLLLLVWNRTIHKALWMNETKRGPWAGCRKCAQKIRRWWVR